MDSSSRTSHTKARGRVAQLCGGEAISRSFDAIGQTYKYDLEPIAELRSHHGLLFGLRLGNMSTIPTDLSLL